MNVEIRQLRALIAVVDAGTFTDAAIDLGVSQASVSRAVASLEGALGVRVLRRTTRALRPTATGASVIRHARRVLAELDAMEHTIADDGLTVRLGYAWSALGRHTAEIRRRWADSHAGRRLELVPCETSTAGLLEGTADVAVLRRPVPDARFATHLVGTERRMAVVASDDPWARRRFVRLAEFAGRIVAMNSTTGSTDARLWPALTAPAELRETTSMEGWLNLIVAGDAVGVTSEATADQHARSGIRYRPIRDAEPVAVRLVWWRDAPPIGLDELLSLVQECYNAG